MHEAYLQIFLEGIFTAIIIPFKGYFGLVVASSFEQYPDALITSLTIAGLMCGHVFNYLLGFIFLKIVTHHSITGWSIERHKDLQLITEYYRLFLLILLCGVSFFGCIIAIFAGFIRVKFILFVFLCFCSALLSCLYIIYLY